MKKLTIFFLLFTTSISAQSEFAPIGATWKYTFHKFVTDFYYDCEYNVCDQVKQRLEVIDTITIDNRKVSVLKQFEGNSTFSDIPEIYFHSRNDSVFFHYNGFHLLYDFTAKDGDTINISVPTYYDGPGSLAASPNFFNSDSVYNLDVVVKDIDSVMVSGEMRRRAEYKSLLFPEIDFTLPNVIDGVGSGHALFGYTGGFVSDGCFGFFICYEDQNQAYTPHGCCEFPEDFPARKYAPIGAEWLYEGWSLGTPTTSGCEHFCEGNYNLFRVESEVNVVGRVHAVVRRYHRTKNTDWVLTDDEIRMYDYDGGFYASQYNFYSFESTYRTDVSVGDTIFSSASQNYPKFIGDDNYEYPYPRYGGDQVVETIDTILIDGQPRLKIKFRNLEDFRIGEVVEGIGPLYDGLLGYDQPLPASGCYPRLLCYRDSSITYTTTDCGCEFPEGPNSSFDLEHESVAIYPNPASQMIFIENPDNLLFQNIELLSIHGQKLKSIPYDDKIDISNLETGIYIIKLSGTNKKAVRRFIKS